MYSSKDLNYGLNEPLHHCFMVFSILADDIKYFKHCIAIFGALNGGSIKMHQKAEERLLCEKYFTYMLQGDKSTKSRLNAL